MICRKYFYNAKKENKQQYRQKKQQQQIHKFFKHPTYYFFLIVSNVAASVSLVVVPFLTKTFITLNYREYASVPLHKKCPDTEFFL